MENEKSNFEDILKNYIGNSHDQSENNIDMHSVSNIVNEKNQVIDELKIYIQKFNQKYDEDILCRDNEIMLLNTSIKNLQSKLDLFISKSPFEIVDYFELQIKQIFSDYNTTFDTLKQSIKKLESSLSSNKQFLSLKNIVNSLMKQNEKLNEDIFALRRQDRINHIYKNLLGKFASQLEQNKKNYDDFSKNHSAQLKNLEEENKILKNLIVEERMKSEVRQDNKPEIERISDSLKKMNRSKLHTDNIAHETGSANVTGNTQTNTNYISSSVLFSSQRSNEGSISERLSKIIASSRIILEDKLNKLREVNESIMNKFESYKGKNSFFMASRILIKNLINDSNDIIDMIKSEVINLNIQVRSYYTIDILLNQMLKEIFSKHEDFEKSNDLREFILNISKIKQMYINKIDKKSNLVI